MPTSLKALADPRVVQVAPELYRLPGVATRVPLDGRVFLQQVPKLITPGKPIPPPQPATRMVPLPLPLLFPPQKTKPSPKAESKVPESDGQGFTDANFPLPTDWPRPTGLQAWILTIGIEGGGTYEAYVEGLVRAFVRVDTSQGPRLYTVIAQSVDCNGTFWSAGVGILQTYQRQRILSWRPAGFVPCPERERRAPTVPPLVEPARPQPEVIPDLPLWIPVFPEVKPVPEEPEEPEEPDREEEETRPLPIPAPIPLPAPVPPVPEVPAPVPNEKETKRRLAPVPVELPRIDPKRAPVPVTEPKPSPRRVEPERPVKVPRPEPLPTPPPTREPAPQPQPQPQPIVPPPVTLILDTVRTILIEREVVRTEPEVYIVKPRRKKTEIETEEPEPEKCEELDCLKIWCEKKQLTLSFYKGEWEEDGYVAKSKNESLVVPGPLEELVDYINNRLSDIKRELCEAIDLIAFLDQEPEPFTDRRKYGPQWKIYWGRRNRTQNSMKRLTLPEVERMERPPEPPAISDGKICLHYGIESVSFWGRIWVGRNSAEALEAYLRQIYGEGVKFTRSENPGREYQRGRLVPTRARYWIGERWLPPV
jgi:hypothetical protein